MMHEQCQGYGSVIHVNHALTHLTCKCELLTGYKGYTNNSNMRMHLMCEFSDNTQQHQKALQV